MASDRSQAGSSLAPPDGGQPQLRNWVRLNYTCNDRCLFCLDADHQDGSHRDRETVAGDIVEGRRQGATRLILSGGEPTIHPDFVALVGLGRRLGYSVIQTITNGRMFAYREFLDRALAAGLNEITFSLHGPDGRIHDALVGVKGAFDQAVAGLDNALAAGRPVVNVDVVVNRANVDHLGRMLELFYQRGVREFDLLQIVPFGRAFARRAGLFYDLEEKTAALEAVFELAERPDVTVWFNRFPPAVLEGHEQLIQDPHKLYDEVRGRRSEFVDLLEWGVDLDCRTPQRCRLCYLEGFCDRLYQTRELVADPAQAVIRVTAARSPPPPALAGDPASRRRTRPKHGRLPAVDLIDLVARARAVCLAGADLGAAIELADQLRVESCELELDDYRGLGEQTALRVRRAVVDSPAAADELLAGAEELEVVVLLSRETAPWLIAGGLRERLVVRQPTYGRASEAAEKDCSGEELAAIGRLGIPIEGLPPCVAPTRRRRPPMFEGRVVEGGHLEIFGFAQWYISNGYYLKSRRCRGCRHDAECEGLHINFVRAHGFGLMRPL